MNVVLHPSSKTQIEALLGRPGGTILLHGPKGVGKRTTAMEVARLLNCSGCSASPCKSCVMAGSKNHPDILLLEPDEKNKIGVEAVHQLQHDISYQQYNANGQRVIIITDSDRLTPPAQNALLKTLEEPPIHTTVLITAANPTSLLPTLRSRCRALFLPPQGNAAVSAYLSANYPAAESASIASASRGLVGQAINLVLDSELSQRYRTAHQDVKQFLESGTMFERLQLASKLSKTEDRAGYIQGLVAAVSGDLRKGANLGAAASLERLNQRLAANVNPKTAFEALAVELSC